MSKMGRLEAVEPHIYGDWRHGRACVWQSQAIYDESVARA